MEAIATAPFEIDVAVPFTETFIALELLLSLRYVGIISLYALFE